MKFSIIVPIYNTQRYLWDCVQSVMDQTFTDWELILVDDGSTDGSGKIADSLAAQDDRIRVVHQDNKGQFFARQAGIQLARGEYLFFLDGDDRFVSDALSLVHALLEQKEWDLVLFLGRAFGPDIEQSEPLGMLDAPAGKIEPGSIQRIVASSERLNSMCFKVFRRSLFLDDETDYQCLRNARHGEDKAMLLHPLTRARDCCYMPRVLYLYRRYTASTTCNIALDDIPSLIDNAVFSLNRQAMAEWGLADRAGERALGAHYLRNYSATYFNLRHACVSPEDRRALRRYPWKSALDHRYFRLECLRALSPRDRLKLLCACLRL